jgi:uncharacterized membrane protein (UPF0127 family)
MLLAPAASSTSQASATDKRSKSEKVIPGRWLGQRIVALLSATVLTSLLPGVAWALERAELRLATQQHTYPLQVEIARTPEQRAFGLMEREQLPDDGGMLFLYAQPQPPTSGFWMYRTRIALDIAFFDEQGEILAIRTMPPCEAERAAACPSYRAGVTYHGALEVNAGYFDEHDIAVGDRLMLP